MGHRCLESNWRSPTLDRKAAIRLDASEGLVVVSGREGGGGNGDVVVVDVDIVVD